MCQILPKEDSATQSKFDTEMTTWFGNEIFSEINP